jgi:hypothetical protein
MAVPTATVIQFDGLSPNRSGVNTSLLTALCRCSRSRLCESAVCSPGSVRLSARRHAREEIESDPILHPMHDTASRTNASDHEATLVSPSFLACSFTTCQTTRSVTPPPQCLPARQTHRNSLPAEIPAAATQSSMVLLTHSGTDTARMWPPLPTRSTMAQCSSRAFSVEGHCISYRIGNTQSRVTGEMRAITPEREYTDNVL